MPLRSRQCMKGPAPPAKFATLISLPDEMKWITREKIKVDRVACRWLILRFIDPEAEFVFLPADTDWSRIRNGMVYDVPDCELGHHGEDVSFHSILKKYKLADPVLVLLGEIV